MFISVKHFQKGKKQSAGRTQQVEQCQWVERIGQCFGLKSYIRTEFGERKYPLRNSETEAGTASETELNPDYR